MDAKIRASIKAAEREPSPENIGKVHDLFRKHGIRYCGCENGGCRVCRGNGCFYPADPLTQIDMLGSICIRCAEGTRLEFHGSIDTRRDIYISCGCKWCESLLEWAEEVVRINQRDAEVVAVEVRSSHNFTSQRVVLHLWEDGGMTYALFPLNAWPLFDQYVETIVWGGPP